MIPTPFDPRLLFTVSSAVAKKRWRPGVATRPITDWAAYEKQLKAFSCSIILLSQSAVKNDDVF